MACAQGALALSLMDVGPDDQRVVEASLHECCHCHCRTPDWLRLDHSQTDRQSVTISRVEGRQQELATTYRAIQFREAVLTLWCERAPPHCASEPRWLVKQARELPRPSPCFGGRTCPPQALGRVTKKDGYGTGAPRNALCIARRTKHM